MKLLAKTHYGLEQVLSDELGKLGAAEIGRASCRERV